MTFDQPPAMPRGLFSVLGAARMGQDRRPQLQTGEEPAGDRNQEVSTQ